MRATAENTHVIVSTRSGTCLAPPFFVHTVSPLLAQNGLREGTSYTVHYTQSEKTIRDLCTNVLYPNAASGVSQNIILLSGDGGIVDIVNTFMANPISNGYVEPVISILPLGTGNALAHSSGITRDRTFGLRSLLCGTEKHLPVFKATFEGRSRLLTNEGRTEEIIPIQQDGKHTLFGAVVFSWGFHASLVADSDTTEYRRHGSERFKMAANQNLFPPDGSPPHIYRGLVQLCTKTSSSATEWNYVDRHGHTYVLATMVSHLEQTFNISPASTPLDGSLRVVHFGPMEGSRVMEIMKLAYDGGKHIYDPAVRYKEIECMRINFTERDPRWRRVCIDGMIVEVGRDEDVFVSKETRRALKIRVFC